MTVAFLVLCGAARPARAEPCHVDEATTRTRASAFDDRDLTAGLRASMTYLEALNQLGQKQPACFDTMEADVPKLRELYCGATSPMRDTDACVLLDKVEVDILRLSAQRLVEAADRSSGDVAKALFLEAGDRYLATYRTYCQEPVTSGRSRHPAPSTCEEIGYNAARAFGAAHHTAKAVVAYRLLVAEEERAKHGSPLAARVLYELGAAYRSMGLFEEAAEWLERLATLQPGMDKAPAALADAVLLRLGLGQDAQAASNVATFTKNWGITRRAEAAQLALTLASHRAEHAENEKARSTLGAAMPMLDRGPPDLIVRAHALAAKVASSRADAAHEWAKVRAAWSDPAAAERALRRGWPGDDEAQGDRRLARALSAVGEAKLAAAEEIRVAEVEPLKLAPFAGPADRAALEAYGNTTLRAFVVKKRGAIERVEAAYREVLDLRPFPPPLSVIAASAAVGAMWGDFADEVRRMPLPPGAWRTDRAFERAYRDALSEASEPIRLTKAKPAMKACVSYAAKYQVSDPRVRQCDLWLASHDKREHHLVDELVPGFRGSGVTEGATPSPPLRGAAPPLDP
jgi:tetratricopeptide (TPR) repeat protein